ncbi:MAG: toll/interleukin-1 receptor domain-containing protein, partial [Nocardioidaceae bacterium]
MTKVFVNYRRRDTKHVAGRLRDVIAARYGSQSVFMDVDSIGAATDFVVEIDNALRKTKVMVILIGEDWLDARGKDGKRRLDDPTDHVRLEIERALQRDIPLLPVVVDSASMPTSQMVPPSLIPMTRYHASRLRHDTFHPDARRVLETITRFIGASPLRWLAAGLMLLAVGALLVTAGDMWPVLLESRGGLPDTDGWLRLVWLLPAVPLLLACALLPIRVGAGVAVGLVMLAALWLAVSALFVWMNDEQERGRPEHLLVLAVVLSAGVALLAAAPELRGSPGVNSPRVIVLALTLGGVAAALRINELLDLKGGLTDRPAFWVALGVPVLVCVPAAVIRGTTAQARALLTLGIGEGIFLALLEVI